MDILILVIFFLVFSIITVILFNTIIPKKILKELPAVAKRPNKQRLNDIYRDIKIEPYGCFTNLKGKFFLKRINPYAKIKEYDSGIFIADHNATEMKRIIDKVIENGFDEYGYHIIKKYPNDDFNNLSIHEIATLGKLSGYNYISVYKTSTKQSRGNIYLTYSPPMEKEIGTNYTEEQYNSELTKTDLPGYLLTPRLNKYTNESEKAPGKDLSCGYPCTSSGKPELITDSSGNVNQYMCGSVTYPDIKTPPRYSVYRIVEIN
jgi:hypothetical protein